MATVPQRPDEHAPSEVRGLEPGAQREPRYGQPFFPAVPFGASIYILATAIALLILSLTSKAPLQNPADPLNHEHINPRPEWYFLFLFQILKIFQGPWEIVGTAVIPGVIGVILVLLPFYDRNWSRRAARRPVAIGLASLTILGLAYLTYLPIAGTASQTSGDYLTAVAQNPKWTNIAAIFSKNCSGCHVGVSTYLGGLNLSSYQGALAGGVGSGAVVKGPVIKPGNAMASYLYLVVEWRADLYHKIDGGAGANMPLGATAKIPDVDRKNIYNWIQNGAKNS